MGQVRSVTDVSFEDVVLASKIPVLLEFWGSWCPPCKMMEPTLVKMTNEYDGKLLVCKLNADQNPHMASQYDIQGVPTFIVFAEGKPIERSVGAQSSGQLRALLHKAGVLALPQT